MSIGRNTAKQLDQKLAEDNIPNGDSIRSVLQFSERRFDIKTLPNDMQRVYKLLANKYGEDYALTIIFTMRTAVELHRAWHMTLLTAKILQQLKVKSVGSSSFLLLGINSPETLDRTDFGCA